MTSEKSKNAAQHIIDDRHGTNYYLDTKLLTNYLKEMLGMTFQEVELKAISIQRDRKGANYYEDVKILAGFIEPRTSNQVQFQKIVAEITKMYTDTIITELLNNLVAIGTWPTPEKPKLKVPFHQRKTTLKKLIGELIEIGGEEHLKNFI